MLFVVQVRFIEDEHFPVIDTCINGIRITKVDLIVRAIYIHVSDLDDMFMKWKSFNENIKFKKLTN